MDTAQLKNEIAQQTIDVDPTFGIRCWEAYFILSPGSEYRYSGIKCRNLSLCKVRDTTC